MATAHRAYGCVCRAAASASDKGIFRAACYPNKGSPTRVTGQAWNQIGTSDHMRIGAQPDGSRIVIADVATRAATAPLLTSIEMLVASSVVVCCRRSGWHPAFRSRVPCRGRQTSTWHWRASFDKLGRALSLPWAAAMPGHLRRARRARGRCHRRRPTESKICFSTNPMYANKPRARSKLPIPLQAHKALSARKGDAGAAYAASHPTRSNYTLIEGLACPTRSIASDTPSDRCRTACYRRTARYSRSSRSSHPPTHP